MRGRLDRKVLTQDDVHSTPAKFEQGQEGKSYSIAFHVVCWAALIQRLRLRQRRAKISVTTSPPAALAQKHNVPIAEKRLQGTGQTAHQNSSSRPPSKPAMLGLNGGSHRIFGNRDGEVSRSWPHSKPRKRVKLARLKLIIQPHLILSCTGKFTTSRHQLLPRAATIKKLRTTSTSSVAGYPMQIKVLDGLSLPRFDSRRPNSSST